MRPRLRTARFATLIAAVALGLFAFAAPAGASTDQDVAYQLDPAHDGYQTDDPITAPLSQVWSDSFSGPVSYPLVANGVVYVTAIVANQSGTTLYAIEQATGATLWSHALGGVYSWSGIAYDAGQVFALNNSGALTAFDAANGAADWTTHLSGQFFFTSPPTATGGYVYVGGAGSGGTLYAVSEASGAVAWAAPVENGDDSSPAVDANGVYVGYGCNQVYDFAPRDGALLWHHSTACEGGGGRTTVLANGEIFARDVAEGDVVLSANDGSQLGSFKSTYAPAVGGGVLYAASYGGLSAWGAWGLSSASWAFDGDTEVDTAPIVVGSLVFEGSASGQLYAVDPATGLKVWSTDVGHAIAAPEEDASELTGLGAGEGTLIVPAGNTLMAYAGANVGSGVPADSVAPTVAGTPSAGTPVGADVGVWTALPTSYGYQWSLCDGAGAECAPVTNATGASYTPPAAEGGDTLEVTVTATNASGTSTSVTSAPSSPIPETTPAVQSPPTISGSAALGQTLSASTGDWTNDPTAYDHQWLRCRSSCAAIIGATSATYTVAAADEGSTLEVTVFASNAAGWAAASSASTATIATPPPASAPPANSPAPTGTPAPPPATVTESSGPSPPQPGPSATSKTTPKTPAHSAKHHKKKHAKNKHPKGHTKKKHSKRHAKKKPKPAKRGLRPKRRF